MSGPLEALAQQLRAETSPISPHVVAPPPERETDLPDEYASIVESVREGYLLHYEESRLLSGHDEDLGLLAGDYLYALGIERLAAMGDTEAVLVLADLISSSAQLHTEDRRDELPGRWTDAELLIGKGPSR
ncbi:MAG: hypothetical protein WDZ46_09315 [Solirubrobacterales bacterium]